MKYAVLVALLLLSLVCIAQLPSTLSMGKYGGVERIQFNPALGLNSPYNWDLTIGGAHIFAQTDYGFIRSASLLNLRSKLDNISVIEAISEIPEIPSSTLGIFDLDGGDKQVYLRGRVIGPSFSFQLGADTRLGFFSNLRMHGSSSNIPENFGIYELNNSYFTELITIENASLSAASWLEIGAHMSKQVENIAFGINVKLIRGHEGLYADSGVNTDYAFIDSVVMITGNVDFDIGFTNNSLNAESLQTDFNGSGIGIDFGASYRSEKLEFGVSITDIGSIRFKSNVEIYSPDILSQVTEIRTQDYRGFSSIRSLIDQIQNDLNITPDEFGIFSIGLPTKISLYGDYRYNERISISAILNQRFPILSHSLKSNNTLVITPRYESYWFGYYMPFTIYEYQSIRIGAAFRAGPLTIGTDHLSSVLFSSDFRGSDLFLTLRLYPFGRAEGGSKGGGKAVLCPTF